MNAAAGDTVLVTLRAEVVKPCPEIKATVLKIADYVVLVQDRAVVGVTVQRRAAG